MKDFFLYSFVIAAILSFGIISCQKTTSDNSSNNNKAKLQIYLTDAPGDFEAVYIDVKDVKINVTGDTVNGWQSLTGVHAGVYDLLKLVNDDDTLLAEADIPSGKIHQLRLILGTENYVKIEGTPQQRKAPCIAPPCHGRNLGEIHQRKRGAGLKN